MSNIYVVSGRKLKLPKNKRSLVVPLTTGLLLLDTKTFQLLLQLALVIYTSLLMDIFIVLVQSL
jgi:hypothetical protein